MWILVEKPPRERPRASLEAPLFRRPGGRRRLRHEPERWWSRTSARDGRSGCSRRAPRGLEDTRLAQPPKAFPDAVPVAELGRERPPRDVVDREIVQRLEELAVVAGKRGKTPGKGYASGVDASGILLKTLSSLEPRTPPSGDLPGVLPLIP